MHRNFRFEGEEEGKTVICNLCIRDVNFNSVSVDARDDVLCVLERGKTAKEGSPVTPEVRVFGLKFIVAGNDLMNENILYTYIQCTFVLAYSIYAVAQKSTITHYQRTTLALAIKLLCLVNNRTYNNVFGCVYRYVCTTGNIYKHFNGVIRRKKQSNSYLYAILTENTN